MGGPLLKGRTSKIILAAYYPNNVNITGGGVGPVMTEVVDIYSAYASSVYTFPKAMRARVTARATVQFLSAGANTQLYQIQSGGLALPIDYRAYGVGASGHCQTLTVDYVANFVAGNAIAFGMICSSGNAELLGTIVTGNYAGLIIEEYPT